MRIARASSGPSPTSINFARTVFAHLLEDLHDGIDALDGPEVREVNDQLVVLRRRAQTRAQIGQIAAAVLVALEKVRDDADVALDRRAPDTCRAAGCRTPP